MFVEVINVLCMLLCSAAPKEWACLTLARLQAAVSHSGQLGPQLLQVLYTPALVIL